MLSMFAAVFSGVQVPIKETATMLAIKGICGAAGAYVITMFYRPEALWKLGIYTAGVATGSIGSLFGIMFSGLIAEKLGLNVNSLDHIMFVSGTIGLFSLGITGWVAMFMEKRADKDIGDVVKEGRKIIGGKDD